MYPSTADVLPAVWWLDWPRTKAFRLWLMIQLNGRLVPHYRQKNLRAQEIAMENHAYRYLVDSAESFFYAR